MPSYVESAADIRPTLPGWSLQRVLLLLAATLLFAFVVASSAAAASLPPLLGQFPPAGQDARGSGAGQLDTARAVVSSPDGKRVYISDRNERINVFTPWGQFIEAFGWGVNNGASEFQHCGPSQPESNPNPALCQRGLVGTGTGQFNKLEGLAVDSAGDLYVVDRENHRVEKFDPSGTFLFMFGGGVNETSGGNLCPRPGFPSDVCKAGSTGTAPGQFALAALFGDVITVGPGDVVYVGDKDRIQAFNPDGTFKSEIRFSDLHVSDPEFPATGEPAGSLAFNPHSGDLLFAFFQNAGSLHSPEPNVYEIDPAGAGTIAGRIQIDTPSAIATEAQGGEGNIFVVEPSHLGHIESEILEFDASGGLLGAVAKSPAGFFVNEPNRPLVALGTNRAGDLHAVVGNGSSSVASVSIYGPPPAAIEDPPKVAPSISEQYAASVDPEGAVVRGKINPQFWTDTTYYLQYGLGKCAEGNCTAVYPSPPGSVLTEEVTNTPQSAAVQLTGLSPDMTYHYRLIAQSGGSEGQPVRGVGGTVGSDGAEGTFHTPSLPPPPPSPDPCPNAAYRSGPAAPLPDCRAYEMVSPVDKGGSDVYTLAALHRKRARLDQAADSGDAFTFSTARAFPGSASGNWSNQYLSRRGGSGWTTESISPPRSGPELPGADFNGGVLDTIFRAFSPDLQSSWLTDGFGPNPDPSAPGGFASIFRRDNATGAYESQIRSFPPHDIGVGHYPELQGVSPESRHAVFRIEDNLTPDAPDLGATGPSQLYEAYREGEGPTQLRLVSVLPGGDPASSGASAGVANHPIKFGFGLLDTVATAVSSDGSRIYWTAANSGPGPLYVRVGGTETEPVSEATGGNAGSARFWVASADGSKALYTYTSGPAAGDLYRYTIANGKTKLLAHKAIGLLGASADLSRFYFADEEDLDGAGPGEAGKPNVYLDEEGNLTYIATLSTADLKSSEALTPVSTEPFFHSAAATPDGAALAFMSSSSQLAGEVAGYDNTDQRSGAADAEVYLYSAGQLHCVSCNPTGQRPVGELMAKITSPPNELSAAATLLNPDSELYTPRYLSASGGRLYFDSFEPLLPSDTDGSRDVYEWEDPGVGSCRESSSSFSPPNGGCLFLISTGQSPAGSEFLDASPEGKDVFFTTLSSLAPQDTGLVDVYDARENGGFPAPPAQVAQCEGEACQGNLESPNDPTPASAAFEGAGNVREATPGRKKAHKKRHKHKKHHKRANSNRRAGR